MSSMALLLIMSIAMVHIVTCSSEDADTLPQVQFLMNPWHAFNLLLTKPKPAESEEMMSSLDDSSIVKSAYLYSNYAGAGNWLRKLKELKETNNLLTYSN